MEIDRYVIVTRACRIKKLENAQQINEKSRGIKISLIKLMKFSVIS